MKNPLLLSASLLSLATFAHAQDTRPLSVKQVPLRADAPVLFAPRGWKIEKTISGNLNRDKLPDAALVLVENKPTKDQEGDPTARRRALVVLLREGKGWRRVGFNGEVLLGTRDGGAFYGVVETPTNVSIKNGVILIEQESGSRDVLNTTHRFRYDAKRKAVVFIGFDAIGRDRLTADVTNQSTNFVTGIKRVRVMKGDSEKVTTKTSRVSRRLRTLESIREEDRWGD